MASCRHGASRSERPNLRTRGLCEWRMNNRRKTILTLRNPSQKVVAR
jgi:hypothetical protein